MKVAWAPSILFVICNLKIPDKVLNVEFRKTVMTSEYLNIFVNNG